MDPQQPAPNPSQPQTVVFVMQGSAPGSARPKQLPLKSFHFACGIVQMVVGVFMFVMEVAAFSSYVPLATGPGIYCGVLIFASGLLSLLGAKLNKWPMMIACMVLNIIASVACAIGLGLVGAEVDFYKHAFTHFYMYNRYVSRFGAVEMRFGYSKTIIMFICCFLEFILTIIHACLSCKSYCLCCMPYSTSEDGVVGQPRVAYQTAFPSQGTGYMPQGAIVMPQGAGHVGPHQMFTCVGPQEPQVAAAEPPSCNEAAQFKYERLSD